MMVIKRNGKEVPFDPSKIIIAVKKANNEVSNPDEKLSENQILVIEEQAEKMIRRLGHTPNIEEIQNIVIECINRQQAYTVGTLYTEYRFKRNEARKKNELDEEIFALIEHENEEINQENSNKDPMIHPTTRDYIAGLTCENVARRLLIPSEVMQYHDKGKAHFHDMDYSPLQKMFNCDLLNLEDMLQNGTVISGVQITEPKSLATAANLACQIITQVSSSQYGGQTFSLAHLAPYVDVSRQKYRKMLRETANKHNINLTKEQINEIAESQLTKEIQSAVQTIQYQLVTMMTTNGQTPFISMFIYLNEVEEGQIQDDLALLTEEILKQRKKGLPNEKGQWVTVAFPKLLYVLDENNTYEGSKYFYLTKLAAEVSAERLVPDYISAKVMKNLKGDVYPCMGCRSFLTPDRFSDKIGNIANAGNYKDGKHKYYGRFNQGVFTINLPMIACESEGDIDAFWQIFDKYLDIAHKALRVRHERLLGVTSDVAPILFQHGAIARLKKGEKIDRLLYDGYSTISLGYAGLYECCKYMTGKSHTDEYAKPLAMDIMNKMNDACKKWKEEENIDYSIYGTPLESTTYKFAKALQRDFGVIKDVSDHNYITNSYHVNVREKIDAFSKLKFEAEFQALSPGGCISYVEVPKLKDNIPAVIKIIQFIYENIMYAEINTKSDYCQKCGYTGEILIQENEHGKLFWECPNCGNTDQKMMNVARRTCGYIGTQFWNQGRTQEIKDRVLHL